MGSFAFNASCCHFGGFLSYLIDIYKKHNQHNTIHKNETITYDMQEMQGGRGGGHLTIKGSVWEILIKYVWKLMGIIS